MVALKDYFLKVFGSKKMTDKIKTKPFRILAIDGGGVRGIIPAKILEQMNLELDMDIHESFDLIAGTSVGAIIAGAIAIKYDLTQLVEEFSENAPSFFRKRCSLCGILRSKYNRKHLEDFLRTTLGEIKLGEIEKPLIMNAANVSTGQVHLFKSAYQKKQREGDYTRDGEVPLFKAVLASCAAPIFFDPVDLDGTLVCDGGVWANNPSLVGYTDALKNFKADKIKILSLGTGKAKRAYRRSRRWGFLSGWKGAELVDFVMSCQTEFPQNILDLIDKEKVLRINPDIDPCELDEYKNIPTLLEFAKSEFTLRGKEISKFLELTIKKNEK